MTSSFAHIIPFLSILLLLLLQPATSTDILAPLLSPFVDQLCKNIGCGKGKCQTSQNHTFGYKCECDQGWKQTTSDDMDDFAFLPCVIPNCTVNYSCTKAAAPAPEVKNPPNSSFFFDPCNWAYCGDGSCTKSGKFGYQCKCQEGQTNLLNATAFPCFNDCALGMDCANLGLAVSNKSVAPPASLTDGNDNHASSILPGKILWTVILTLTIASSSWK